MSVLRDPLLPRGPPGLLPIPETLARLGLRGGVHPKFFRKVILEIVIDQKPPPVCHLARYFPTFCAKSPKMAREVEHEKKIKKSFW